MNMSFPVNSVYIVQGEVSVIVTALRRANKWSSHSFQDGDDPILRGFSDLKEVLNHVGDLAELDPGQFLGPFLEVIRSENTTGPVTGLALSSIYKFLTYGLIDTGIGSTAMAVESITDAVTHARFVGTDPSSDEVVLMKILQVLRILTLSPVGTLLTNESICEIMQSCFRICFEMRLSDLLRKSAEHSLVDMVQLLFARLPQFVEDNKSDNSFRRLKMRPGTMDTGRIKNRKRSPRPKKKVYSETNTTPLSSPCGDEGQMKSLQEFSESASPDSGVVTPQDTGSTPTIAFKDIVQGFPARASDEVPQSEPEQFAQEVCETTAKTTADTCLVENGNWVGDNAQENFNLDVDRTENPLAEDVVTPGHIIPSVLSDDAESCNNSLIVEESERNLRHGSTEHDYVNPRGVRFTAQQAEKDGDPLISYGLPCVRELFRFLTSLINPFDKHNSDVMIHIGLSLLTISLESGAYHIEKFPSMLAMVKDEMCRNLFFLVNSEKQTMFAASLRVCFLLFEALRGQLKFQLEMYLTKLMAIIMSDSPKIPYEQKETVLESLVQLWRIPGLVTELYLNFDCDLYCSNLFEELTKLLSKNCFPVTGLYSTHLLSLDALLTVIDSIEFHCHSKVLIEKQMEKNKRALLSEASEKNPIFADAMDLSLSRGFSGYMVGQSLVGNRNIEPSTVSKDLPKHEDIIEVKKKKKLLAAGTEQFNCKPSKGIQFLQEYGFLGSTAMEVVNFLKENPRLDKKMIGEYISNRKNLKVLEAFVRSFNFEDNRVDEALRFYLETFRLPGEAPVISLLLEHFAEHWHKSNGEPFVNSDAAFTLAYAVIMLNVDQHNYNAKKQSIPMTVEDFKKNLSKVNGGSDFDQDMLEEIYTAIKHEEIVMPAEQTGLVKENYLWKMLLRRGSGKEGTFIRAPNGLFDRDLFSLIWGPTVAALSFIFDKSVDGSIVQRATSGFRKCAMISAHYGMCDVFDHLMISLCKFTALLNSTETLENLPIAFGNYSKAQLASKTAFNLTHRHGDILREGWKNILDVMLQLYKAKLLPKILVEAEDFVDPSGRISLTREDIPSQRSETGLFSSFYSYITLTNDSQNQRGSNPEDEESIRRAQSCIAECHPEHLITESKFLRLDSLQELVKALIFASPGPDGHASLVGNYDEDCSVFFLELLAEIVLQNRDRVNVIWQNVRDHIYSLMMGANATEHLFLLERSVVCLLRLAIRLLWREDMTDQVLQSLRMLILLKPSSLLRVCQQISFALYELLKTNAANIHTTQDWATIYMLLECAGAGAKSQKIIDGTCDASENGAQSDSEISVDIPAVVERGYTSDSELELNDGHMSRNLQRSATGQGLTGSGSWILIGKEGEIETFQVQPMLVNQYDIFLEQEFIVHDGVSFFKSCESLAFLIRDGGHITSANLERCVHCVRVFAEASLNGGKQIEKRNLKSKDGREKKMSQKLAIRRSEEVAKFKKPVAQLQKSADDGNDYHQVSIQLLDLMHTLHTRASSVIEQETSMGDSTSAEGGNLWFQCWCPILQGIARMCCDNRRTVRSAAMTYLQRALLVHDLQKLTPVEWESCFNKVLFPLLAKLLENVSPSDPAGLEETRMRGATLLCKVFLQHLNPLLTLPTFAALWLTILDFMDKYMHSDKSDLLCEAIPESLKNMLLVMDTAGIFGSRTPDLQLWNVTWDRIGSFLPGLRDEVFKPHHPRAEPKSETIAIAISDSKSPIVEVLKSQQSTEDSNQSRMKHSQQQQQHSDVSGSPSSKLSTDSAAIVGASIILQPPLSTDVVSRPTLRTMTTASASLPILLNTCIIDSNHIEMSTTKTLVETISTTSRIPP